MKAHILFSITIYIYRQDGEGHAESNHIIIILNQSLLRCNSHTIKFTPLKYKIQCVFFSIFKELYNHHHYLILGHFQNPSPKPHTQW